MREVWCNDKEATEKGKELRISGCAVSSSFRFSDKSLQKEGKYSKKISKEFS